MNSSDWSNEILVAISSWLNDGLGCNFLESFTQNQIRIQWHKSPSNFYLLSRLSSSSHPNQPDNLHARTAIVGYRLPVRAYWCCACRCSLDSTVNWIVAKYLTKLATKEQRCTKNCDQVACRREDLTQWEVLTMREKHLDAPTNCLLPNAFIWLIIC